jgi:hypothetical protein
MSDFKAVSLLNPVVVLTGGPVISAGASSQAAGMIVFSNSNNVSFGLNNGTMTASVTVPSSGIAAAAGTQTASSGTLMFANSNGITFGMSGSNQITASHNALIQSVADTLYFPRAFTTEPNGFPDRTQVTVSWDDVTRTLTISPVGADYVVWSNGTKFTKNTTLTVTISNTDGNHWIYFDDAGNLVERNTFTADLILRWGLVSILYWDLANLKTVPDAQTETHGADWPPEIHLQQHVTVGVRFQDGLEVTVDSEQDGSLDAHIEVATTVGHTWDEDIQHTFNARAATDSIPIMYRVSADGWSYTTSPGPIVLTGGTGLATFNEFTGTVWQQTEMTDGTFGVAYLYAMPSHTMAKKLIIIQGQAQYISQADAGVAASNVPQLGVLPLNEMKLIAAITFETNSGYTNSVKSRVVRIGSNSGSYYVDWRYQSGIQVAVAGSGIALLVDGHTYDVGIVPFGNANGVSFLTSNGSVVGSHDGFPTANTTLFAGSGFTGTNVTGTLNSNGLNLSVNPPGGSVNFSAGTTSSNLNAVTFSNANGVSFGMGTGLNAGVMTGSIVPAGGAQTAISGISAGTQLQTVGTLEFVNSNNFTFGMSNSSQLTASFSASQQPMAYSAANGNTTANTLIFANSNGVSFSTGTQGLYATVATNYQSQAAYLTTAALSQDSSNYAGVGSAITNGTMTYNTAGLSLNLSNHLTTAMASNASTGFAGTASAITNGTMTYNTAGLSLNLSNHLTTAMLSNAGSNFMGLNSALTANGVSVTANSSGLSLNFPAFLTTALQSQMSSNYMSTAERGNYYYTSNNTFANSTHSHGNPTLALTNLTGTTASASNGFTLSLSAAAAGVGGAIGFSGSNGSFTASTVTFGALNGMTFYTSNGSMVASYTGGGGAGDGYNIITIGGNTSGTATSYASATVMLAGGNNITMSQSSNSISINGPDTYVLSAQTNITLGTTGSTVGFSVAAPDGGNTLAVAGSTANSNGIVQFSNANGVSFGLDGSTMTASVAPGAVATVSSLIPGGMWPASTASQTLGVMGATTASAFFWPVVIDKPVLFDHVMLGMNLSCVSSTVSGQQTVNFKYGIYSDNASTLSLISSNSFSMAVTNSSSSMTFSYPSNSNTTGFAYTTTSTPAFVSAQGLFGSLGIKLFELPFSNTMSLSVGRFWFGVINYYSSSSANIGISMAMQGNAIPSIVNRGGIGNLSSVNTRNIISKIPLQAMGVYTSTGSAGYDGTALPVSVFMSGIANTMTVYPCLTFDKTM